MWHIGSAIACQGFDIKYILLLIYYILKCAFTVSRADISVTLKVAR